MNSNFTHDDVAFIRSGGARLNGKLVTFWETRVENDAVTTRTESRFSAPRRATRAEIIAIYEEKQNADDFDADSYC